MQHHLESCNEHRASVHVLPRSRQDAIGLIHKYFHNVDAASSYRFVSVGSLEIDAHEAYEVEAFTLGLRHYGDGVWGLTEVSAIGDMSLPADFYPTVDDVFMWLTAEVAKLRVELSKLRIEFEHIEDFHVLQVFLDAKLLKSITWNVPVRTESHYQIPHPTDSVQQLWGDALITDIKLVRCAVARLKSSLLPVVEVV